MDLKCKTWIKLTMRPQRPAPKPVIAAALGPIPVLAAARGPKNRSLGRIPYIHTLTFAHNICINF